MNTILLNQVILPVVGVVVATILEVARRQIKAYLDSKQELIEKQKEALKQSIGIDQYNKDVTVVKQAVYTVEQLGKEFDWKSEIKHAKVLQLIEGKTGLTDEEIYNLIKAFVLEVNSMKTTTNAASQVVKIPQSQAQQNIQQIK